MFKSKCNVRSTLINGPAHWSKSFTFEAAIHFAEEGRRVVYITPAPLQSLPRICHGRSNPAPATFKLMRFMYLENHEALVERLAELHTFAVLPSVLLIDDFDTYVMDNDKKPSNVVHIAATCALIFDTMNSCARLLQTTAHVFIWSNTVHDNINAYTTCFRNIWNVSEEDEGKTLLLRKLSDKAPSKASPSYKYAVPREGVRVLKEIYYIKEEEEEENAETISHS